MNIEGMPQHQILDHLYDGLYVVDQERKIVYWNPAAARITGYSSEEMVGRHCYDNLLNHVDASGCSLCHGHCPLVATMGDGDAREALVYLRHQSGSRLPVEVRASALRDAAGNIVGAVEAFQDGRRRETMGRRLEELEKLAEVDALTQLANRRSFDRRLSDAIADFHSGRRALALLILDVDRFKSINDTHGHPAGDRALQTIAGSLAAAVREDDVVARIGGEEFAVLTTIGGPTDLSALAHRIGALIRTTDPLLADGSRISVTASLGGAIAGRGETAADLLRRADQALYSSKQNGRDRFTLASAAAVRPTLGRVRARRPTAATPPPPTREGHAGRGAIVAFPRG